VPQPPPSSHATKVAINFTTRSAVAIVVMVPGPQTRSSGFPLWLLILLVVLALLVGIGANRIPVWVRRHRERQAGAS